VSLVVGSRLWFARVIDLSYFGANLVVERHSSFGLGREITVGLTGVGFDDPVFVTAIIRRETAVTSGRRLGLQFLDSTGLHRGLRRRPILWRTFNRRRAPRFVPRRTVEVEPFMGRALDISPLGLGVLCSEEIEVEVADRVTLRLALSGVESAIEMDAVVRSHAPHWAGARVGLAADPAASGFAANASKILSFWVGMGPLQVRRSAR